MRTCQTIILDNQKVLLVYDPYLAEEWWHKDYHPDCGWYIICGAKVHKNILEVINKMRQIVTSNHELDDNGNPEGGTSESTGLLISWQRGPLGRGTERKDPNGCFVETVIGAAIDRLNFYQKTKFNCQLNADAIKHLNKAMWTLQSRTADRESREVEGTHAE